MTLWTSNARARRKSSPTDRPSSLAFLPSASGSSGPEAADPDEPAALLAASALFDAEWYAEMSGSDPRPLAAARHYLRRGAQQGLHPHPLFAPEHVVVVRPELAEGVDPLVSYLETRAFEVSTHPLFDVASYLADNPSARTHPGGPLAHYVQVGAREGLAPNEWYRPDPAEPAGLVDWVVARQRERSERRHHHPRPWTRQQPRVASTVQHPVGAAQVSVVIEAGRRFEPLERTVRSVLDQQQPAREILVATDGSIPDLRSRLERLGSPVPLVLVPYGGTTPPAGLNLACARAGGDYLAWAQPGETWAAGRLRLLQGLCVGEDRLAVSDSLRLTRRDKPATYACARIPPGRPVSPVTIDPSSLVVRRSAFEELGGFDESLLGAWGADLGFRLLRRFPVHQVPDVGTTRDAAVTHDAGRLPEADRPVVEHSRVGAWADSRFNEHAVDWESLARRTRRPGSVTVVVVADSGWRQTLVCVSRVQAAGAPAGMSLDCLVVDDGSDRLTSEVLASLECRFDDVRVRQLPASFGSSLATNLALVDVRSEVVVLLNRDVRVRPGWLEPLTTALRDPEVLAAQSLVTDATGAVANAGFAFPGCGGVPYDFLQGFPAEDASGLDDESMPALSRAALALRFGDLVAVRGLDPLFKGGLEDVDLCRRLRRARDGRLVVVTGSRVTQKGPQNRPVLNRQLLLDRWGDAPEGDDLALWARRGFDVDRYVPAAKGAQRRFSAATPVVSRPPAQVDEVTPRLRWALKVASPAGDQCEFWGDTHFARRLAVALRELGQEVVVDHREGFERPTADLDDVVLVLRGLEPFTPAYGQVNLAWVISHPEMVSRRELAAYDRVVAASSTWAARMSRRWDLRIEPLLQATDPTLFHPDRGRADAGEPLLFVGGSRRHYREIVMHSVELGLPLSVYGADWEGLIPQHMIKGRFLPNEELGASYASAGLVLNDHWEDMRREGFLSNRLFDAVASGARVISDDVEGLHGLFGSSVQVAEDASALQRLVSSDPLDLVFGDAEQRRAVALEVHREHSFHVRATRLLETALEVRHEQLARRSGAPSATRQAQEERA